MEKKFNCQCKVCNLNFDLDIEPSYSFEQIERDFPNAKRFMERMMKNDALIRCPACGEPAEAVV